MPNSELGEKILAENKELRREVACLGGKIEKIDDKGKHTRWGLYGVVGVIALVLVVWGAAEIKHVNNRVDQSEQFRVAQCEATNVTRMEDLDFWTNDILKTIGSKQLTAAVQPKVNKRYAQRDCSPVREGGQPSVPTASPSSAPEALKDTPSVFQ